jgi:hypothetical protein
MGHSTYYAYMQRHSCSSIVAITLLGSGDEPEAGSASKLLRAGNATGPIDWLCEFQPRPVSARRACSASCSRGIAP